MIPLIKELILLTLKSPKGGAAGVLQIKLQLVEVVMLALLMCISFSILTYFQVSLMNFGPDTEALRVQVFNPLNIAFFNITSFVILVGVTQIAGNVFGGKGNILQTLQALTWMQFVAFGVQLVVYALGLGIPFIAPILSTVAFIYYIVLYCNFVVVIHNFKSAFKVFLSALLIFTTFILVISTILGGL